MDEGDVFAELRGDARDDFGAFTPHLAASLDLLDNGLQSSIENGHDGTATLAEQLEVDDSDEHKDEEDPPASDIEALEGLNGLKAPEGVKDVNQTSPVPPNPASDHASIPTLRSRIEVAITDFPSERRKEYVTVQSEVIESIVDEIGDSTHVLYMVEFTDGRQDMVRTDLPLLRAPGLAFTRA